jgi:hypothetical protein
MAKPPIMQRPQIVQDGIDIQKPECRMLRHACDYLTVEYILGHAANQNILLQVPCLECLHSLSDSIDILHHAIAALPRLQ